MHRGRGRAGIQDEEGNLLGTSAGVLCRRLRVPKTSALRAARARFSSRRIPLSTSGDRASPMDAPQPKMPPHRARALPARWICGRTGRRTKDAALDAERLGLSARKGPARGAAAPPAKSEKPSPWAGLTGGHVWVDDRGERRRLGRVGRRLGVGVRVVAAEDAALDRTLGHVLTAFRLRRLRAADDAARQAGGVDVLLVSRCARRGSRHLLKGARTRGARRAAR